MPAIKGLFPRPQVLRQFEELASQAFEAVGKLKEMLVNTSGAEIFWPLWLGQEASHAATSGHEAIGIEDILAARVATPEFMPVQSQLQQIGNYQDTLLASANWLKKGRHLDSQFFLDLRRRLAGENGDAAPCGAYPELSQSGQVILTQLNAFLAEPSSHPMEKLAVTFAVLEAFQPFKTANSQLGRILVPLFLMRHGGLEAPLFYLGAYFNTRKDKFRGFLAAINDTGGWEAWINFFLRSIIEKCYENMLMLTCLAALRESTSHTLDKIGLPMELADFLFRYPLSSLATWQAATGNDEDNNLTILGKLRSSGLVELWHSKSIPGQSFWRFSALIELLSE